MLTGVVDQNTKPEGTTLRFWQIYTILHQL